MKKVLFLLVMAVAAISASAQITWNAKGGVGIAHCWGDADGLSSHFVGKIGAGIEKPLTSNWSLMPSLEVAWKGCKFEGGKVDIFYVQVPVLAAYRLNLNDSWNMTLKAGPYIGVGVYGNVKADGGGSENLFSNGGKRLDAGLDLGIDFEYHRFVFGVEYELGFTPLLKDDSDGETYSVRNAAFYATVGYKF